MCLKVPPQLPISHFSLSLSLSLSLSHIYFYLSPKVCFLISRTLIAPQVLVKMTSSNGNSRRRRRLELDSVSLVSTLTVIVVVVLQFSSLILVKCQSFDGNNGNSPPGDQKTILLDYLTGLANDGLANLTKLAIHSNLARNSSYCIDDPQVEWNRAFNFSSNLTFVANCILRIGEDITRRICTVEEMSLYFNSFSLTGSANSIKPNRNCNRTSWLSGCEPGWGCSIDSDGDVNFRSSQEPARTQNCQPCCEGFFCPRGLTCMIPCPLGSYCPLATLNKATGLCDPYNYQLPSGQINHTCGGANIWADVSSSSALFCSAGSYCPTNIERLTCSKGYYCPKGSTAKKRCFKLTSCDPNTANQNIHAYGVMLIAAMTTILLIIYNCSDQFLTTQERRRTKTRETAARNAKEKAQARARWKSAKEAAKKHAIELQTQVSQTFSRRKAPADSEKVKILNETDQETDTSLYSSTYSGASSASEQSLASAGGMKVEEGHLTRMYEIEDYSDSFQSLSIETDYKKDPKKTGKDKEIHTHSQIFKYAYSQLEKEKAQQQQNKNLTFSGVISMATDAKTRKRPVIEIVFRDLTVTLKGKKKHLLRSVTGKVMPGRITAVMGPSGAGKTTLLSALAGKALGCTMSGMILVNGKNESIHSYKKIIGFVPQDDIVHGNLTVEENLWFSARCRLSADMPKPDKVLVVERVIEFLGLQAVRGSLVGTVEKRGISGGQRKRVNVGLELVMEPSLLFLDEPTSGLDSSSSQLLLRALRREAIEGVNICMVVHQPSYTLFQMFDDLILLAKGGLTVYHGSVRKVEEYFAGLGINVPERINPPDYFIDVLEGMVKPSTSSNVSYEELPIRWMLHNGYSVPQDMQQYAATLTASPTDINSEDHETLGEFVEDQSFAGEMWQDVKCNMERHRDILRHNFLKSKDLSNRKTPNALLQYKYFLGRIGKQRLREARLQAIDYLILLVAGACLGSISRSSDEQFGAPSYIHTIIAVSLLCKVAALRTFSLDKLQYWRESASGISSLAHFVSKDTIDQFNTVIKPVVYLSMFYFFNNPRSTFADNYIVLLCLVYCVTGIAYVLAIFLHPGPSQLLSVLLPVVLTLIASQPKDNKFLKIVANFCYPRWALEAFVIANAERYYGVWIITRCAALMKFGYDLHRWYLCLTILILTGVVSRIIAFFGMLAFQRK